MLLKSERNGVTFNSYQIEVLSFRERPFFCEIFLQLILNPPSKAADPRHFYADLDPHFTLIMRIRIHLFTSMRIGDPGLTFHSDADLDLDQDPAPNQSDANL
jgi:hypothetical protein